MRILNIFLILLASLFLFAIHTDSSFSRDIVLYSFEKDPQGWEIPDWARAKKDHVAEEVRISEFQASNGKYALEMLVDFTHTPGWQGAYVERVIDVTDWSPFKYVSIDIFLPQEAPRDLRARIVLTAGDSWKWTEMNKTIPLAPGEWTVIKADLTPDSMNWRRFVDEGFRSDVKKIGIRVESNGNIAYKGPVYIDNMRLTD